MSVVLMDFSAEKLEKAFEYVSHLVMDKEYAIGDAINTASAKYRITVLALTAVYVADGIE